jgi:hypothetical protein
LIDAWVYELYGLTEEEIGIVEAGSPGKCAGESLSSIASTLSLAIGDESENV